MSASLADPDGTALEGAAAIKQGSKLATGASLLKGMDAGPAAST